MECFFTTSKRVLGEGNQGSSRTGSPAWAMYALACAHRIFAEMEDGCGQDSTGMSVADARDQMVEIADAA